MTPSLYWVSPECQMAEQIQAFKLQACKHVYWAEDMTGSPLPHREGSPVGFGLTLHRCWWLSHLPHSPTLVSGNSPYETVLSSLHTWPSLSILGILYSIAFSLFGSFHSTCLKNFFLNYFEWGWSCTVHRCRTHGYFGCIPCCCCWPWCFCTCRGHSLSFPLGFAPPPHNKAQWVSNDFKEERKDCD